jgi:hypothetical protein
MPANVFAQYDQVAAAIEDGGGVQAAGLRERLLGGAHPRGQFSEDVKRNLQVRRDRREMLVDRFDGRLAAKAATGGSENMTREALEIDLDRGRQKDI